MMKMSIRQHGNAASTATSVTYPLGDRVRNRGRGFSLSEISIQASNQYGHHIEQEEDAGSGDDSGSGSDRDDHNEDQHGDEGHQSTDEDNHDNEDNTMTKESTVTQEPASTQPPGFPNFEQGLMPGGPQQSIKPGLTAIYPTDERSTPSIPAFINTRTSSDEETWDESDYGYITRISSSRRFKNLIVATAEADSGVATVSETATLTETQGQPTSAGKGAATTTSKGDAIAAPLGGLPPRPAGASSGNSGNTDSTSTYHSDISSPANIGNPDSLRYLLPQPETETATDLGSPDEATSSFVIPKPSQVEGIILPLPGGPFDAEITVSSSSTPPPVTKSTSSETETITFSPPIKTTNAAGSNPSPATSSPGQDLTSEAKTSSSSVKQGSSSKGYTSRHSSSKTKSTSGGGIPTTATVSASFEPLTTSDASPSSSPDPVDNAAGASEEKQESSSGNSGKKGAIHGAVAAVGLLILGAILFFLWRRHKQNKRRNSSRSSTSQLLSPKSAGKLPEKSNSPSPFDDSDDRGSVGRTSPWTFDGVAAAVRKTVRPSTSAIGLGAGVGVAITTGPSPVSPASSKGDAVSVGGLSSLSRGSSFSFTSTDDYSCHESATSGTSSIFQATALAYPTPGRVTPVMGATGTARIVDISPKPQRPEMVMVKSNRNSSSAELLSLSRNPSNRSTIRRKSGIVGKGVGVWDKEACGCRASKASASTATGGQWDKEACGCGGSKRSTATTIGQGQWDKETCGCGGKKKKGAGQWDKEACGCGGGSKRSTVTEVSPPPMAARSLYEALGGGSGPGPVPVSNPSPSRPVTWMRQPSQPSPLSTARNSAASGASTYVPSPIGGTPAPERNRRSYMG